MSKLTDLFDQRARAYASYSDRILKQLESNVLPAIVEVLDLTANELEKLEWKNVQLQEEHLILSGVIGYKEGDVIKDGELKITLDTQLAMLLDKIIRVAVPLSLAESGTKQEVTDHLREAQRQLHEEYEAIYGHEPPTMEEAMEGALRNQLGMDFGPDFDYNDLSEEQKQALHTTMIGKGDKLN